MANNNYQNRTQTSTQIRNLYSDGMSYLNIRFFNTNLSFSFSPFISKDANGLSNYDTKNAQQTTVNFESAFTLFQTSKDIISGKITECDLPVPCLAGAILNMKRELAPDGKYQTILSITKNNVTIPFKFQVTEIKIKENGQQITKNIESGLGAFMKTIEGYLNGINADRHLDKLTEDFAKLQQGQNNNGNNQQSNQQGNNGNYNNNYRNNNNNGNYYKKPYNNNNGGYKKPYNNNYQNNNQNGGWNNNQSNQPKQQDMSSYNIQN